MNKHTVLVAVVLLSMLVLAIAGCDSSSPPSPASPSVVYADTLGAGWEDWSWDCQCDTRSAATVHEGEYAIAVDYAEKGFNKAQHKHKHSY